MDRVYRFLRRIAFAYKQESLVSDWKMYILFDLIPPIAQTLCFSLVAYHVYGPEEVRKWLIGNVLLVASFQALFGVGTQLMTEKYHGTLSLLIASKTKLQEVFLTSTISAMVSSFITVVLALGVVSSLMKLPWSLDSFLSLILVLVLAIFVSMSFGFLLSCFILLSSEVNLILNLVGKILLIFTGANFPLEKLPPLLQGFPKFLPLTRSIAVAQELMVGNSLKNYGHLLIEELALGVVFIIVGSVLLRQMEYQSRQRGSLELV